MREWVFRLFAIVFAFALFEGALRVLDQPRYDTCWVSSNELWREDPVLGFSYAPGVAVAGGTVNAIGLRGPVPAREKPAGTRRILYVGDSTAFGFGVPDDETFWSLATREVAAQHPDRVFEPLVAAAPGYSSYQSRVLVDRMLPFAPDWVVFHVGAHNDGRRRSHYEDAEIPARAARRNAAWHQIRALRAGEFLIDRFGHWMAKRVHRSIWFRRVPPEAFEANMTVMIAAARSAGAQPLILVPPLSDSLSKRYPGTPVYHDILRRVAAEQDVPRVELQPIFAEHDTTEVYRTGDDVHPSPLGQRLIARAIARAIEDVEGGKNQP
jgi:lysophospholipase L1-like esterase